MQKKEGRGDVFLFSLSLELSYVCDRGQHLDTIGGDQASISKQHRARQNSVTLTDCANKEQPRVGAQTSLSRQPMEASHHTLFGQTLAWPAINSMFADVTFVVIDCLCCVFSSVWGEESSTPR
jgi:hypothetical protein